MAPPRAWSLGDILAGTLAVTPHATALITGGEPPSGLRGKRYIVTSRGQKR
ncbi:MAG TPA: hypothetical protein VEF72_05670 [Mycobacterium sp.]|jgi:hypothetical protein|nr:hypothetical protein [Mycobacterium sp.]